jgi:acetyl esterase
LINSNNQKSTRRLVPDVEERIQLLAGLSGLKDMTPEIAQLWKAPYGPVEEWDLLIEDHLIEGPHGLIPLRVYSPAEESDERPCLVWCHGGGWAYGDLDMPEAHEVSRGVAGRANGVVVSVDYRLCPKPDNSELTTAAEPSTDTPHAKEVRFPIPHDDVMTAYRWTKKHSEQLKVDGRRIAIGGASAGANLAAGVALHLRDENENPWQVLLSYPVVHPTLPQPSAELAEAIALTPRLLRLPQELLAPLISSYLGAFSENVPSYAFPGTSSNLAGYAPTYINNAEFDELRSSGEEFAKQLLAAGVEVEQEITYGTLHGYLNNVGHGPAKASMESMAKRLRR